MTTESKSLFTDAERDDLRKTLAGTYSPPEVEEWLNGAEEQGWSFERASVVADAVRTGAYL